ncbi:hypothetical protein GMORB2_0515 [Geosmithia morbida]|uniref:Uncharacterized protein n=1 Tax=Geosmithia morbida TaxID=1094350 RepID=A0A9P4Z3W2_9HYPO|nr:uncharacterized protein GMORB2_0515 [Geosmithia morbida]KAF4126778.1 hypothetical protein GMORB2_0515 [Geosmithia morbida]
MGQGEFVHAQASGIDATAANPDEQLRYIRQYERIVQLRHAVLAGLHPTIKLPPGVAPVSRTQSTSHSRDATQTPCEPQAGVQHSHQSAPRETSLPDVPSAASAPDVLEAKRSYGSGSTEINPILLEKSAELVKAEFRLQRQRLERDLKVEFEQRRGLKQSRAEALVDYDIAEVLGKALELVPAAATPPAGPSASLATNDEAASDSFDDNTFYSSKHATPESRPASRIQPSPEEVRRSAIPGLQSSQVPVPRSRESVQDHLRGREPYANDAVSATQTVQSQPDSTDPSNNAGLFRVPGLNNYTNGYNTAKAQAGHPSTGAEQSQSRASFNAEPIGNGGYAANKAAAAAAAAAGQHQGNASLDTHPPSPLIRTHDMIPVAPQPAPYTTYAVEQQLERAVDQGIAAARGAPAQVAALRNEPITRQRQANRQEVEVVAQNGPAPVANTQPLADGSRPYQGVPMAGEYGPPGGPPGGPPQRAASTTVVGDGRYAGGVCVEERRPVDETYIRHASPRYIQQPLPGSAHPPRPVSQVYLDDSYHESPHALREPYDVGRMGGGPYVGQPMPPLPPTRIFVDAFGREYIEPGRPPLRQSIAPTPSQGPEIVYDRPSTRALSRHPGATSVPYEDGRGVVYARAASAFPGPRRVMTQPEYASQDFRDGRPREYSVRPAVPQTEYVQVMAPPPEQWTAGAEGEYPPRTVSTRPPMDPVRYEVPPGYGGYATGSVYPEARREPYMVEYAGQRPPPPPPATLEQQPPQQPVYQQRAYSTRPVEPQYYGPGAEQLPRGVENVGFTEHPRGAAQEVVYPDNARREVYR